MTTRSITLQDDGYTLLEMLVAVAILAMLSVPIAGSISLGLSSWKATHEVAEQQERVMLVQERLSQWFKRGYPLDISRSALNGETRLVGGEDTVEFSAPIHPDPWQDNLSRIRLRLHESKFQVGVAPDFSYLNDATQWEWTDLLSGVETLSIEYLEGFDVNRVPVWSGEWTGVGDAIALPIAIKIDIAFTDSSVVWPGEPIPFQVGQQAYCNYLSDETCQPGANVG